VQTDRKPAGVAAPTLGDDRGKPRISQLTDPV
jgi:hypothetical protein